MSAAYISFVIAIGVLVSTPGPSTLLTFRAGAAGGYTSIAQAIFGVVLGSLVLGIGLGVISTCLSGSPFLFTALRIGSAVAAIVIGVVMMSEASASTRDDYRKRGSTLYAGFLISVSNPKPVIFYLAVIPRMLRDTPDLLTLTVRIAALVLTHITLELVPRIWTGR